MTSGHDSFRGRPFDMRWQLELARLHTSPIYFGREVPRGDGKSIVLIPGLFANDATLAFLYGWLRRIGYRPHGARSVFNADCWQKVFDRLDRRVVDIAKQANGPLALIGHSRGGHLARALGHRRPELVDTVITLGTPLINPYDIARPVQAAIGALRVYHSRVTDRRERRGCLTHACSCSFLAHLYDPLDPIIALTSIYSRDDGVVPARACTAPDATAIEISGSHIGLAWNHQAYFEIAQALHGGKEPPSDGNA